MASRPRLRPEHARAPARVQRAQPRPATRRCSTARRRPATRRARRSRSSPRPRRSTRAVTRPTRASAASNGKMISGVPLNNFGSEDFGDIDLTDALTTRSTRSGREVGEKLGKAHDERVHGALRLLRASRRSTYPRDERAPAASACDGRARPGDQRRASTSAAWRSARTSCTVTPLQMAMVAADDRQRRRADEAAPRRPRSSTPTGARVDEHRARGEPSA